MANTSIANTRLEVKEHFAARFLEAFPDAIDCGGYVYAIPYGVTEDGKALYGKFELACPNWYATKTAEAFDPGILRQKWELKEAERAEKAEQKAAEKAARKLEK